MDDTRLLSDLYQRQRKALHDKLSGGLRRGRLRLAPDEIQNLKSEIDDLVEAANKLGLEGYQVTGVLGVMKAPPRPSQ